MITMERVLIVDDSPLNRLALKRYFLQMGHEVIEMVGSAEEGKEKFLELKPTLVTIDQILPNQNGTQLARFINSVDRQNNTKTKLIMISSDPLSDAQKRGIHVDFYIIKPATSGKIEEALNSFTN